MSVGFNPRRVVAAFAVAALVATISGISSARSLSPAEQRGATFARANCARCHSIDKASPSSLAIAPPFRDLHKRYAVETLEEPLAEGIVTGHANMPEFRLEPDQIGDFIKYLKTLE